MCNRYFGPRSQYDLINKNDVDIILGSFCSQGKAFLGLNFLFFFFLLLILKKKVMFFFFFFYFAVTEVSAIYAAYRNIMFYSTGSDDDPSLNAKATYKNLVRPGLPTFDSMSPSIISIMEYLNWRRVALIISHSTFCESVSRLFEQLINDRNGLKVTDKIIINDYDREKEMEGYLDRLSVGARSK